MVTFYEIDDLGNRGKPVLYLDTLKVSTIEQTAEQTEARGGKGNPPLVIWDYGKEINVTLEDALFSAKSMAIMFGNGKVDTHESKSDVIYKTLRFRYTEKGDNSANKGAPASWKDPNGNEVTIESATYYSANGSSSWDTAASVEGTEGDWIYMTFPVKTTGSTIEVSANTFPGTLTNRASLWGSKILTKKFGELLEAVA